MHRVVLLATTLVLAFFPAPARGAAPEPARRRLTLDWAAPPSCPSSDRILSRVAALIALDVEQSPDSELSAQAVVTGVNGQGFTLQMTWVSEAGRTTRSVSAESCDEAADAAALFIAFSLAPERIAAQGTPTPGSAGPAVTAPIDPRLSPLIDEQDTRVHPLSPESPANDAGDPDGCFDRAGEPLSTDQRGTSRIQGARCDIGAYEAP